MQSESDRKNFGQRNRPPPPQPKPDRRYREPRFTLPPPPVQPFEIGLAVAAALVVLAAANRAGLL